MRFYDRFFIVSLVVIFSSRSSKLELGFVLRLATMIIHVILSLICAKFWEFISNSIEDAIKAKSNKKIRGTTYSKEEK